MSQAHNLVTTSLRPVTEVRGVQAITKRPDAPHRQLDLFITNDADESDAALRAAQAQLDEALELVARLEDKLQHAHNTINVQLAKLCQLDLEVISLRAKVE